MNKNILKIALFFLLYFNIQIFPGDELKIYVSVNGNDNSNGNFDSPLKTIQKAIENVKPSIGKLPISIIISEGNYRIEMPLEFNADELGSVDNPLKIISRNTDSVVISGGIKLKNWKKESNGIWSVTLPENYSCKFNTLYVNDRRAIRARFPDKDYLHVKKAGEDNRTNFFFEKNDFPNVNKVSNLELVLLHDWSITRICVKEIDWENLSLKTVDSIGARSPAFFNISNWEPNPRYFLENAIEFCNSPGEWYCDFEQRKIYYVPFPNEDINELNAVIPISPQLVKINGDRLQNRGYINFEGITFEHTNWVIPERGYCGIQACMYDNRESNTKQWNQVPAAIEVNCAENILFKNCTVKHTDGSGIWFKESCVNCEIADCKIYDIAGNGISIGEGQDRQINSNAWWKMEPTQISSENKIKNSMVENCGVRFFGACGIWCGLVSNTLIEKNVVKNLPYTGISVGWMWDTISTPCANNTVTSNHIYNIMNILSDGGGLYFLGKQPGSKIINNIIHDVKINAGKAESNGMFLDEGSTELLISENIVYNIARSPLRFHKATKNIVRNNILMCDENNPEIRYNRTEENDIVKTDNLILLKNNEEHQKMLKEKIDEKFNSNYFVK
ncbi:MAG: right-handed parallel beta-helix repeat-containing protein [Ignavibacteriae bacterium]|nr:right-handed parallel beta-helix repeat-containing protein [Ignavibacteriota bacterium]